MMDDYVYEPFDVLSESDLELDERLNYTLDFYPAGENVSNEDAEFLDYAFAGDKFKRFGAFYDPAHKPLTFIICLFGVVANALNIIVLTRKRMVSPTNILLTGLSVNQLLLLLSYLSLLLFNFLIENCLTPSFLASYNWTLFKWTNVNMNVAFHTTALSHTMCLTLLRFFAVESPTFSRSTLTVPVAKKCVVILFVVVPILCSPTFFTTYVAEWNGTICGLDHYYDLNYVENAELFQATLWTYGVLFKLVPSLGIGALSIYLIISLKNIDGRKMRLTGGKESSSRKLRRKRLTKMLVTVALLCVAVELPHGVLNLLTGIFGASFATEVYDNLGDFFEMLTLFYSSVNFVLYCLMSTQFQSTFKHLMFDPIRKAAQSVYSLVPTVRLSNRTSNNSDPGPRALEAAGSRHARQESSGKAVVGENRQHSSGKDVVVV